MLRVDVLLEELARRRRLVDVDLFDVDPVLIQETPGVLARRSRGLGVEDRFRHAQDCTAPAGYNIHLPGPC
jgi:hypothetical protein